MKKLLLSSVTLLVATGSAVAADLPTRVEVPFVAPPVFTWSGFYAGVNLGGAFLSEDDSGTLSIPATAPGFIAPAALRRGVGDDEDSAITGGAQIGYNWQFGQFVLGAEADINFLGLDDDDDLGANATLTGVGAPALCSAAVTANCFDPGRTAFNAIDWFGTLRLRAGYAIDRLLIYGTGGFAFGNGEDETLDPRFVGLPGVVDDDDDVLTGWTVGGGFDYAFTDNLVVGVEGLYVNLDRDRPSGFAGVYRPAGGGAPQAVFATNVDDDDIEFGVVRARLNYKF